MNTTLEGYKRVNAEALRHAEGVTPIPRAGIFTEEAFNAVVKDEETIIDDRGLVAGSHSVAYPNSTGIYNGHYLLRALPAIGGVALPKGRVLADLVSARIVEGGRLDKETSHKADSYDPLASAQLRVTSAPASLLHATGAPLFHYMTVLDLRRFNPIEDPLIIDSYAKPELMSSEPVIRQINLLERNVLGSEHSRSIPFSLEDTITVDTVLDPDTLVVAHTDSETGEVDCMLMVQSGENIHDCVDSDAFPTDMSIYYVESLATLPEGRGAGSATRVVERAASLLIARELEKGNDHVVVAFDTAAETRHIVPMISQTCFANVGVDPVYFRVDSLHHVILG